MFKIINENKWYNSLSFTNYEKKLVRKVIKKEIDDCKISSNLDIELTRINWTTAYLKDDYLNIYISTGIRGNADIKYVSFGKFYTSHPFFIKIPMSAFILEQRNDNINKLLNNE